MKVETFHCKGVRYKDKKSGLQMEAALLSY
jgi:hypothetical protein